MRGLERARHQAQRSLKRRMGEKETQNPAIIAKVGNGAGTVVVPGRSGWIYVRLHGDDNQLTEAKLGIPLDTASLNDAWVRVRRASPRKASYYVVEEFVSSSGGDPTPPLQEHSLDPDDGPHTGSLTEDDVGFDDAAGHDHQGTGNTGRKVDHTNLTGVSSDQHHAEDHKARHQPGGEDALPVGTPSDIGTTNAEGSSTEFVRKDHVHKHPPLTIEPHDAHLNNPCARVYHDVDQEIADGTPTILSFNSERFDNDDIHDTVTNNDRFTCNTAGKYQITAQIRWESNATGYRQVAIRLNGSTNIAIVRAGAHGVDIQVVSTLYDLAVDDYLQVVVVQNSGAALDVGVYGNYSPEFMMVRVG